MKTSRLYLCLFLLLSPAASSFAQGLGKAVDDGAAAYAGQLARFHGASVENLLKRPDLEPFAISFFGWRALTITRLPFNKLEGAHLNICRLGLNIYNDKELDATLQALTARATEVIQTVEATEAEKDAIQKFVVRKYGTKYLMPGLAEVSSGNTKAAPPKVDETAAWKYRLGAALGELSGSVIKWFWFPNNPKYDAAISGYLLNIDKEIKNAPKDAPPELMASLQQLAAFGSKKFFSPAEREQIGTAIKQTLPTTLGFAKPLPTILQDLAKAVETANPKPSPATADTAKAKEMANQYRQEGLKKFGAKLYDPAIGDFNRALEIDPNNPLVYFNRGQVYIQKGEYDLAIADLTKSISFGGTTAEDYYALDYRALAYIRKNDLTAALADLNQALALNAQHPYGYYLRGVIYKSRGNTAAARADFQAALTINPNYQLAKDELAKLAP